jgi:hypothetical protein
MIAQFVDDLLLAIGEASIEELEELFASRPGKTGSTETQRPGSPSPSEPARRGATARGARAWVEAAQASPPPTVAEITDPESLLSLVASHRIEAAMESVAAEKAAAPEGRRADSTKQVVLLRPPSTEGLAELEGDSPASGVRPVGGGAPVRLSDNETLARVSNAGVVIRRRKKA